MEQLNWVRIYKLGAHGVSNYMVRYGNSKAGKPTDSSYYRLIRSWQGALIPERVRELLAVMEITKTVYRQEEHDYPHGRLWVNAGVLKTKNELDRELLILGGVKWNASAS